MPRLIKTLSISFVLGFGLVFALGAPFPYGLIWRCPPFLANLIYKVLLWPQFIFYPIFPDTKVASMPSDACITACLVFNSLLLSVIIFGIFNLPKFHNAKS